MQPVHPRQLVVELGPRPRIAVGRIHVADQHAAHRRLDVAAVARVGVVGQAAAGLDRLADPAQDRDSVPALLAVPDRRIAERLDRFAREGLVGAFQLLQPDDVGRELLEPAGQDVQPRIDPVDVVARDSEPVLPSALRTRAAAFRCPAPSSHRIVFPTGFDPQSFLIQRISDLRRWNIRRRSRAIVIACFRNLERGMEHGTPATSVAGVYSFMGPDCSIVLASQRSFQHRRIAASPRSLA